jgi:hypothetical protein
MRGDETIWFDDVPGFFRDDRLSKFLPMANTPLPDQLNAIMRFALYFGSTVFLFKRTSAALYIVLATAAVTYFVFTTDRSQEAKSREALATMHVVKDTRTGEACTRPTKDNPFMNVLVSDYDRFAGRPKACDISQEKVNKMAEQMYTHNLYKDGDDVYNRNTSSRQFYANPSTTIPNDQAGFASWLYGTQKTCKEGNGDMCAVHVHKFVPGT